MITGYRTVSIARDAVAADSQRPLDETAISGIAVRLPDKI